MRGGSIERRKGGATDAAAGPFLLNPDRNAGALGRAAEKLFPPASVRSACEEIRSWPGYEPTPLLEVTADGDASGALGDAGTAVGAAGTAGRVFAKLERGRFGLGSFKVLGGACAVRRHAAGLAGVGAAAAGPGARAAGTPGYVCGSAGNHGLAVAWGARGVGRAATVFVPETTSRTRVARLRAQDADVRVVPGAYAEALRSAEDFAGESGGVLVSDFTDREDGTTAPVLWGYALIAREIAAAGVRPTHVFVAAGVGSLAAAIVAACHEVFASAPPRIVVVEPTGAACVFESLRAGRRIPLSTPPRTRLAPLACRVPSADAWPLLAAGTDAALKVADEEVQAAGALLGAHAPTEADNCGPAALAGVVTVASDPAAHRVLGLGPDATVVALVTE